MATFNATKPFEFTIIQPKTYKRNNTNNTNNTNKNNNSPLIKKIKELIKIIEPNMDLYIEQSRCSYSKSFCRGNNQYL